jgi:protein-disulfide isomerase
MSKRDQQRQKKEAMQQAAAQREQSKKLFSKVALFGIVPVLAVLVLYTLFTQGPTYSTVEIAENDHVRGRESNPVTIVVYADFQCPACATENECTIIYLRLSLFGPHFPASPLNKSLNPMHWNLT